MNPLISVIVPVYNVEKYLRKCVDSILSQTYQNIEIILVDDGSKDNCSVICDEFAAKDARVRVIHKENGGLSDARNTGIDAAAGEYFGFVDGDDYINPEMYEKLYNAVHSAGADLSICGYDLVDENGDLIRSAGQSDISVVTREEAFEILSRRCTVSYITAVNKLYKSTVLKSMRFPAGKLHEDEFAIHHVFGMCERVAIIPDRLYDYVQREGSITADFNPKRLDSIDAVYDRFLFFNELGYKRFAGFALLIGMNFCFLMLPKMKDGAGKKRLLALIRRQIGLLIRYPNLWVRAILKIDN